MVDTAGHITIDKFVDELLKMPPGRRETAARSWIGPHLGPSAGEGTSMNTPTPL